MRPETPVGVLNPRLMSEPDSRLRRPRRPGQPRTVTPPGGRGVVGRGPRLTPELVGETSHERAGRGDRRRVRRKRGSGAVDLTIALSARAAEDLVEVTGVLDYASVPYLRHAVFDLLDDGRHRITLD